MRNQLFIYFPNMRKKYNFTSLRLNISCYFIRHQNWNMNTIESC